MKTYRPPNIQDGLEQKKNYLSDRFGAMCGPQCVPPLADIDHLCRQGLLATDGPLWLGR